MISPAALLLLAQTSAPQAAFLDDLARRAYATRDYPRALALFSEVQIAAPSRRNLYNMAISAELSARAALAFSLWTRYLAHPGPDAEPRIARARARRDALRPRLALVEVDTDPPGAAVFADRRELGRLGRSPTALALDPGPHRLWAELEGYSSAASTVTATRGAVSRVHLALTPRTGRLTVHTSPKSALELARGDETRRLTWGVTSTVPVGRWRIVARAEGFLAGEIEVVIREGGHEARQVSLRPEPQRIAWLLVSAKDLSGRLFVDETERARLPARIPVQEGLRNIEVRRDGRRVWGARLEIEAGASRVVWVPR